MKHLLSVNDMSLGQINQLLDVAQKFLVEQKLWGNQIRLLEGYYILLLFFESSTRTRTSFELAARRLGAEVINVYPEQSAIQKHESVVDTAITLNCMSIDALVIRHPEAGMAKHLSKHVDYHVINAGDGDNEHPTHCLLYTSPSPRDS